MLLGLSVTPAVMCREWRQKTAVLTVGLGRAVPFLQRLRFLSSSFAFLSPFCHTASISGASTHVFQDMRCDSLPVFAKAEQPFQLS